MAIEYFADGLESPSAQIGDAGGMQEQQEKHTEDVLKQIERLQQLLIEQPLLAARLQSPVNQIRFGIVVEAEKNTSDTRHLPLLPELLRFTQQLKQTENSTIFLKWISEQLNAGNIDHVLQLTTALTSFSLLLNSDYFGSETAREEIPQEVSTLSMSLLNVEQVTGNSTKLERALLNARFAVIRPDLTNLSDLYGELTQIGIDEEEVYQILKNYFKNADHPQAAQFLSTIKLPENIRCRLEKRLTRIGILPVDAHEKTKITEKVIEKLSEKPWIDAAEIDYSDIVRGDTHTIILRFMTGTFGFGTLGHRQAIERILAYLEFDDSLHKGQQSFLLVLPNLVPGIASSGVEKDSVRSGFHYERTASLLLQLGGLDRKRLLVSTALQPHPQETKRGRYRVQTALNRLHAKITFDVDSKKSRLPTFEVRKMRSYGIDELSWIEQAGKREPSLVHAEKFFPGSLFLSRHGWQIDTIQHAEEISRALQSQVFIAPGSGRIGSTEAISVLHMTGDLHSADIISHPFIEKHWSEEAINQRRLIDYNPLEEEIISVTDICQRMISEYKTTYLQS